MKLSISARFRGMCSGSRARRSQAARRRALRKVARDERGQAFLEYILILSVVVVGAAAMGRGLLTALDRGVLRLGGQLEKDLKTGRAPLSSWKN